MQSVTRAYTMCDFSRIDQSANVIVGVQAVFLGMQSQSDLIQGDEQMKTTMQSRAITRFKREADFSSSSATRSLPYATVFYIAISKARKPLQLYRKASKDCTERMVHAQAQSQINGLVLKYQRLTAKNLIEHFHFNTSLENMVTALISVHSQSRRWIYNSPRIMLLVLPSSDRQMQARPVSFDCVRICRSKPPGYLLGFPTMQ